MKDFRSSLSLNQSEKRKANYSEENERLRDTIEKLKKTNSELEHALKNEDNEILISDIKLLSNIRSKDNYDLEDLTESIKEHGQLQPVLLTSDNYLVAGNRRYSVLKSLNQKYILAVRLDKPYQELKREIDVLQFEENEQRKSLDNFEISDLFKKYLDNGYSQAEIGRIFNKQRQYLSSMLKIQNLDQELKSFLLEFQIYAWSKEKFKEMKALLLEQKKDIKDNSFYINNKGFIGGNLLAKLSRLPVPSQRKKFFELFKDRLTEEEKKNHFSDLDHNETILNKYEHEVKRTLKVLEKLEKSLFEMPEELDQEKKDNILKAIELLQDASKILS